MSLSLQDKWTLTETFVHNSLCFFTIKLIPFWGSNFSDKNFSCCSFFFQENHARMMLHMNVDELQPLIVEIFDLSSRGGPDEDS